MLKLRGPLHGDPVPAILYDVLFQIRQQPRLGRTLNQLRPADRIARRPDKQHRQVRAQRLRADAPRILRQRADLARDVVLHGGVEAIAAEAVDELAPALLGLRKRLERHLAALGVGALDKGAKRPRGAKDVAHPVGPVAVEGDVDALEVGAHERGGVGGGQQVPVGKLRVAKGPFEEGGRGGHVALARGVGRHVGDRHHGQADDAGAVEPEKVLRQERAPVVADHHHLLRHALGVEDLGQLVRHGGEGVGRRVGRLGAAAVAELVGDHDVVRRERGVGEHVCHHLVPHEGVVWEAVDEEEGRG
ncbi:hypothetical protein PoMZ_04834 [Pyricularia oryzae]|uniref:Uncharacterized protein n=1 Tax=Pyricularia oryzae TaxID=318829 RepID=A0A4P7NB97_PYROR|nr:hypothetical protein PoMZ_04834 [Pyricularia oryzae]